MPKKIGELECHLCGKADIPGATEHIATAARAAVVPAPREVWCAGGHGTLASGIAAAWPDAAPAHS